MTTYCAVLNDTGLLPIVTIVARTHKVKNRVENYLAVSRTVSFVMLFAWIISNTEPIVSVPKNMNTKIMIAKIMIRITFCAIFRPIFHQTRKRIIAIIIPPEFSHRLRYNSSQFAFVIEPNIPVFYHTNQ